MRFTKMHGAGNDYVYINCFDELPPDDVPALARKISHRHTGIGSDGLILIGPSPVADARMQMWNADGSPAEMCGNGLRCVAKYLYERGIARRETLRIETGRGVLTVQVLTAAGRADSFRINMGPPILQAARIPTTLDGDPPVNVTLTAGRKTFPVTCVSMGNPHCVVFVDELDELDDAWVLGIGPKIERHPAFPQRTNVEFVQVASPTDVAMRVWERGSGETLACGTGACAAIVAGVLTGRTGRNVCVRLPGGALQLEWSRDGDVSLTGPAREVFQGEWAA